MARTRAPQFSGKFYPSAKKNLQTEISRCFSDRKFGPGGRFEQSDSVIGGIVPHAGYFYSGACAANFYSILPRDKFRTIVLLGTNHTGKGAPFSIGPWEFWETPLGKVPLNIQLAERLSDSGLFKQEPLSHIGEHSIEVQLPFLQTALEKFSILPITVSVSAIESIESAGRILAETVGRKKTLFIASSDLNHYEERPETEWKDSLAIDSALSLSPEKLLKNVSEKTISMCGVLPSALLLQTLSEFGDFRGELLKHHVSGDVLESGNGNVGYASIAFFRKQ